MRRAAIWPLLGLAIILVIAAYLRFVNLTNQGMDGCDTFQYWILGHQWSLGNFTLDDGFAGPCFRPVAFALHGLAMWLFGSNDYAIKVLHASMDVINIVLVFIIGAMLVGNRWGGICSAVLYAFIPSVITVSRQELLHIPSATFLLLAALFYVLFEGSREGRLSRRLIGLVISGFFLGCLACLHTDLALLGFPMVVMILLGSFTEQKWLKGLGRFVVYAAIFTLSYLSLFLVSGLVIGFGRLWSMTGGYAGHLSMAKALPFQLTATFLTSGLAQMASVPMEVLFIGTLVVMVVLKGGGRNPAPAYLPWVLWVGYGVLFEVLIGPDFGDLFRVLIPLLPFAAIGIVIWYWRLLAAVLHKEWMVTVIMVCGCTALAGLTFLPYKPDLVQNRTGAQTRFRAVYDLLKDKVDEQTKLLVTPYLEAHHRRGFQQEMYFGNKAVYIIDLDPTKTLDEIVRELGIRYIYIGNVKIDLPIVNVDTFNRHDLNDPAKCVSAPLVLGGCYGMNNQTYSLGKEYAFLGEFIRRKYGKPIWLTADGALCEFPRP